ncbi:MAG: ABC transporter substrate-binding protein, partial [Enhydrobacter sp.]
SLPGDKKQYYPVASVMKPAGFENAQGIITAYYQKDPTDKRWDNDADMKTWRAFMEKYMPGANTGDANYVYAYGVAFLMHETLKRCGDELTRANVMKQAASFNKFKSPVLIPGITISTSATDFYPIQSVQLARFKDDTWDLFGDIMAAESA